MIEFPFKVNKSFLNYKHRPITVPKRFYNQLLETTIVLKNNIDIICPDGSHLTGYIYKSTSKGFDYFQICIKQSFLNPLGNLKLGERLNVKIYSDKGRVEYELV